MRHKGRAGVSPERGRSSAKQRTSNKAPASQAAGGGGGGSLRAQGSHTADSRALARLTGGRGASYAGFPPPQTKTDSFKESDQQLGPNYLDKNQQGTWEKDPNGGAL